MKIAIVVFRYSPYGGLERDMLRVAECAARRGHAVTILTTNWHGDMPEGIAVEIIPISAWSNHKKMREFEKKIQPRLAAFDVSAAFNRIPGCDFYFAADECYAVTMAEKHDWLTLRILPRYRSFLDQERRIFFPGVKTKILTLTVRQKRDYQRHYGTEAKRFIELPPGIDPRCVRSVDAEIRRDAMRKKLNLSDGDQMILLAGSNFLLKGADRAVLALAALPETARDHTHFFFAGRSDATPVLELAEKLGVACCVHALGARDDVPDLLLAADLAVLLSRHEATGTFLAEAIASGCPAIASGACGFAPLVAAAGGGIVPEPFDQRACNAMVAKFLAENKALRQHAVVYAGSVDFTRRADAAVDAMGCLKKNSNLQQ